MANTFTQIYIHIVFAVYARQQCIPSAKKEDLHRYITRIVQNRRHQMIAINSMPDHIHLLIGFNPDQSLSFLVRDIKAESSRFINSQGWISSKFRWQSGYGAFSYGQSQLDRVVNYIRRQEQHHGRRTFRQECKALFEKFEVDYDARYLPGWEVEKEER